MMGLIATFVVLIGAALFVIMVKFDWNTGPEAAPAAMGALLVFVMTDIIVIALLTAGLLQWFLTKTTDRPSARPHVAHNALPES